MGTKIRALGADVLFLAAFESAYGTPPAGGVWKQLLLKSTTLGAERPLGYDPLLGQGRDAADPHYDAVTVAGDLVVPVDLRAFGFWLKGLFGAPVTADTGGAAPYTHVFTSGGDLPPMAFELGHAGLTAAKYIRHAGAMLGGLSFSMARTGPVNATIPVTAQGETEHAASIDADPASFALRRFSNGSGSIRLGGAQLANVVGGSLAFSNNLDPVNTIRDDGLIDGVDAGEATCTGTIAVRMSTDTAIPAAVAAETPVAMEYRFVIPGAEGYQLKFELPRVFLPRKKGELTGPAGIERTYDWRAAKDPTLGYLLKVALINDVEAY